MINSKKPKTISSWKTATNLQATKIEIKCNDKQNKVSKYLINELNIK